MGHMDNMVGHMKDAIVESIAKCLQNSEENFPKGDDQAHSTISKVESQSGGHTRG